MADAFLIWRDGELNRLAPLLTDKPNTIGRAWTSVVAIGVNNSAVSREHAIICTEGRQYVISHRSMVNPTLVNGRSIDRDRPTKLNDKDTIEVGGLRLIFHDLTAGDHVSSWICGKDKKVNSMTDADCRICGTSRAYAISTVDVLDRVLCRVLAERSNSWEIHDLYKDDHLAVLQNSLQVLVGRGSLPTDTVASVELADEVPILRLISTNVAVTLNGEAAVNGQVVKTGDELSVTGNRLWFLVRRE